MHLIGLGLKKELEINWLVDFRDPWTTIGYHKQLKLSVSSATKHKQLEKEVMNTCDGLIVTSPTTKKEFESITSKPIIVITNGYDVEKVIKKPLDDKFTMAHIGSFLSARNPRILWKALTELIKENSQFKQHFHLKLIGAVSVEVFQAIKEFKLDKYVNHLGYLPHNEAISEQRTAQVLLLIEIDSEDTKCIIPGKLFEYMVSERPIIAIGPENADFAQIIKETNSGKFFKYDELEALKTHILTCFEQYQQNSLKVYPVGLQQYSRKSLTEKLAKLLNSYV
jgi:glycosyltransferase involved in cell wall biosynthesis